MFEHDEVARAVDALLEGHGGHTQDVLAAVLKQLHTLECLQMRVQCLEQVTYVHAYRSKQMKTNQVALQLARQQVEILLLVERAVARPHIVVPANRHRK